MNYKIVNDTAYHNETPDKVVEIIEEARLSVRTIRLRFCFGDPETGRDWEEIYDTTGYIGRSTGSIKIPLLIKKITSTGGGGLLDHCIVKIERKVDKKYVMVYTHPKYHKDPGYKPECPLQIPLRDDLNPTILQTATNQGWSYDEPIKMGNGRKFGRLKYDTHGWECIWSCIHGNKGPMWVRADLINERYTNHMYYYELLDALKGINGVK